MATTKQTKPSGPDGWGLKVIPKREGFRRAGYVFSGEGQTIPYADLTPDQVELLKGEPALVVIEVELPKDEAVDGAASAAASTKKK